MNNRCVNNRTVWWTLVSALILTGCSGMGSAKMGGTRMDASMEAAPMPGAGSGVVKNGAQDASYFRHMVSKSQIPYPDEITVEGVFAQHTTHLPSPKRDRAITLHPLLGVSVDPVTDTPAAVVQLGMNSHMDFSGLPRVPVNLAVVIDKSGSMNDDHKMTYVKEGLKLMLESLGPDDHLSIVTYDTRAQVLVPSTALTDPDQIAAVIDHIYPSGATNLHDGMVLGYEQLLTHYDPDAVNRLMLLSDGVPTVGVTDGESIQAAAGAFDQYNISMTTVGVGKDFNHALMVELARAGGGNAHFLRDPDKVRTVFRDELETTLTPVAEDVLLTVELHDDVTMTAAHGLPLAIGRHGHPELYLPTLYLSKRNGVMLLELDLQDLLHQNDLAKVATVHIEYTLTHSGQTEEASYPIHMPARADWPANEHAFFENNAIRRNFDLLMTVYALQDACDAWHNHDPHTARQLIAHTERFLSHEAHELEDSGLMRELTMVQQLAQAMGTAPHRHRRHQHHFR